MGIPAKVLGVGDVRRLLRHVQGQRHSSRNVVLVLLSVKAGLRAAEMAGLDWRMVLRPNGKLGQQLTVCSTIAKNSSGRRIPINPELASAFKRLRREQGYPTEGAIIRSEGGGHMRPGAVVNWFRATYDELGLEGCSSHSGRRTFITRAARLLHRAGGSLRDVQELAGHRALTTTERYIEGDRDAQRTLVRLI
jgi:integrase/recombinase XerD